jgi:hypothetical protein
LKTNKSEIIINNSKDGKVKVDCRLEGETLWLTQTQIAKLLECDVNVVSEHIKQLFAEGELDSNSNTQYRQVANLAKPVLFYSLDVILTVGYRVKCTRGTQFSQWVIQFFKDIYKKASE